MKALKVLLFLVGGVIALVVVAAVALVLFVDVDRFKPEIEKAVKDATGRTLKLEGRLRLAFWPSIGVQVAKATLSERGSTREFLQLESAQVSVALLPLLRGELQAEGVRVGRTVLVQRGAGGEELTVTIQDLRTTRLASGVPGKLQLSATVTRKPKPLDARAQLQTDYRFDLERRTVELPKLALDLQASSPELPHKLALQLEGTARADLEKETAAADLQAKFDESRAKAKLAISKFSSPHYQFDLDIDRLNLDRYRPAPGAAPAGKPAAKGAGAEADPRVDLSGLKGVNANGRVAVGELIVQGLKLAAVKSELRVAGGKAEAAPHSASLYGGTLAGALTANASGNQVALKEVLSNVSIGPLVKDLAGRDALEGHGNVALDVTTAGPTVGAMKKGLAGSARLALKDGAVKGINLAESLRKARAALGSGPAQQQAAEGAQKTDFSELTASFVIRNGVAHNDDLDAKSPFFRLGGAGDIDIGNSTLNYVAKASVVSTAKGQGGAGLDHLDGLTVPVKLSGSFDAPKYEVDYRAAAASAAKSEAGKKAEEALRKSLRDLLKR